MGRYQEEPFWKRWFIWLRWMPYAYLRGTYWFISQYWSDERGDLESLDSCIDISVGGIQAVKMHWVYSAEECMQMSRRAQ